MAVTHPTAQRNLMAEERRAVANGGTTVLLTIFDSGDTELVQIECADFGAASGGVITSASSGNDGTAGASGTASYGTIGNDTTAECWRGACGVGSGEIQINTLTIAENDVVSLTANITYTAPT